MCTLINDLKIELIEQTALVKYFVNEKVKQRMLG